MQQSAVPDQVDFRPAVVVAVESAGDDNGKVLDMVAEPSLVREAAGEVGDGLAGDVAPEQVPRLDAFGQ